MMVDRGMSCAEVTLLLWGTGSTRPSKDREHPCTVIKACRGILLLDCGEGCQKVLNSMGVGHNEPLGILISHLHGDHVLGVAPLLQTLSLMGRSNPVFIIGPYGLREEGLGRWGEGTYPLNIVELTREAGTLELRIGSSFKLTYVRAYHAPFSYSFVLHFPPRVQLDPEKLELAGIPPKLRGVLIEKGEVSYEGRTFTLGDFVRRIIPGAVIAYSGDTLPNPLFAAKAKHADVMIHEATFASDVPESMNVPHSTPTDAAETAAKARVKLLVLVHFSPRIKDLGKMAEEAKRIFPRVVLAKKGLKISVEVRVPRVFRLSEVPA